MECSGMDWKEIYLYYSMNTIHVPMTLILSEA